MNKYKLKKNEWHVYAGSYPEQIVDINLFGCKKEV